MWTSEHNAMKLRSSNSSPSRKRRKNDSSLGSPSTPLGSPSTPLDSPSTPLDSPSTPLDSISNLENTPTPIPIKLQNIRSEINNLRNAKNIHNLAKMLSKDYPNLFLLLSTAKFERSSTHNVELPLYIDISRFPNS